MATGSKAVVILAALAAVAAAPAAAQTGIGLQVSYADEPRAAIGARAVLPLGPVLGQEPGTALAALRGMVSVDQYPSPGYTEINANLLLPLVRLGRTQLYAGGGLHTGWDGGDSATGLNGLGGATLRVPLATLFAEGRIQIGGAEQTVFTLGFLLGRG